jgi:hypothetical protein
LHCSLISQVLFRGVWPFEGLPTDFMILIDPTIPYESKLRWARSFKEMLPCDLESEFAQKVPRIYIYIYIYIYICMFQFQFEDIGK